MDKRKNRVGNISPIQFDFSKLVLTIKGSRKFPQVKLRALSLAGKVSTIVDGDL